MASEAAAAVPRVAATFEEFMVGRSFATTEEAMFAWEKYQAAASSKGIVIGTNAQVQAHAGQDGFAVLNFIRGMANNMPPFKGNWTWAINKAWLALGGRRRRTGEAVVVMEGSPSCRATGGGWRCVMAARSGTNGGARSVLPRVWAETAARSRGDGRFADAVCAF